MSGIWTVLLICAGALGGAAVIVGFCTLLSGPTIDTGLAQLTPVSDNDNHGPAFVERLRVAVMDEIAAKHDDHQAVER